MKIEFTKEDLDYLAERIVEKIQNGKVSISKPNHPNIDPKKKIGGIPMSGRLRTALSASYLLLHTIEELSEVNPAYWVRVKGISRVAFPELMRIFADAGCSFGDKQLVYDYDKRIYTIQ